MSLHLYVPYFLVLTEKSALVLSWGLRYTNNLGFCRCVSFPRCDMVVQLVYIVLCGVYDICYVFSCLTRSKIRTIIIETACSSTVLCSLYLLCFVLFN